MPAVSRLPHLLSCLPTTPWLPQKEANLNAPAIKKWLSGAWHPIAAAAALCPCSWCTGPLLNLGRLARACVWTLPLVCPLLLQTLLLAWPPPAYCAVGAEPSDTVGALLKKAMVME